MRHQYGVIEVCMGNILMQGGLITFPFPNLAVKRYERRANMALSDPQTVTVATVAKTLARTGSGMMEGQFSAADAKFTLSITHTANSRFRHSAQLRMDDIVSNPLVPSQNVATFATVGITINAPKNGLSNTQISDLVNAFQVWLTPTIVGKLVTGEA